MALDEEDVGFNLDYETDLAIDPSALDIAALEQPNLAMKYSKAAAFYKRRAARAHEKLKTVRSELVQDANLNPDGCLGKGNKATAPNVEAYYRTHPDYIAAKTAFIDAEYDSDLAQAAADHMGWQRRAAIERLTELLRAEYFAGPVVPRDIFEEFKNKKKELLATRELELAPSRQRRRA